MLGEFIQNMINIEKIELLFYYELGKYKWIVMGEEYKLDGVKFFIVEIMDCVKGIFESYGYKVIY